MDDQELCAGLAAKQAEAFVALVERYGRWLMLIAIGIVRTKEAAEDVVYGVIARWWADPPRIDPVGIRSYLARCISNAAVDYLRRDKSATGNPPRSESAPLRDRRRRDVVSVIPGESDKERYEALTLAMRSLGTRDQDVLELYYGRPLLTPAQRAAEMEMTVAAYKKAVHDAKGRLNEAMTALREARHGQHESVTP